MNFCFHHSFNMCFIFMILSFITFNRHTHKQLLKISNAVFLGTNTEQSNATYKLAVLFLFALHVSVIYNHLQRHMSL
jgi:hypothetical protein